MSELYTVFIGKYVDVLADEEAGVYVVKHGPNKSLRKTFKGESAWSNAQRFCWDAGDLTCNL